MASAQYSIRGERLTKRFVEALPVPDRDYGLAYDRDLTGFVVRVSSKGIRTYFVSKRLPTGRQCPVNVGRHGQLTADEARSLAKRLLGRIAAGDDPAAERRAARQAEKERRAAPTVAELADRYLAEHVAVHNKPRTRAENRRMVENILKPAFGRLKVQAAGRVDVQRLHRELAGTPRQANHVLSLLSKMFNLAELWGLRPDGSNPCRHVRRYRENARDRFLIMAELERLGAALREMEAEGVVKPAVTACIRLLALSGMRLSEAVELEWNHVDLGAGVLRLPDAKAGARLVPLGAPAMALLAALGRGGERVFGALTSGQVEKAWAGDHPHAGSRKRARPGVRDRAGIPDARLHDLRHTMGTYAGGAGLNAFVVRDLLGHKTMSMAGRYVSRHADPLRQAADVVSGQIAAALDGGSKAEVVALRR